MPRPTKLTKHTTETQFDNGYWYADELKAFAKAIGIANSARLRKDELETLIKQYLRTGRLSSAKRKNIHQIGPKDFELGLTLSLRVKNYSSNKETKRFIETEAQKINPRLGRKSGVRYRLNRWREDQINNGRRITYGHLVKEYVRLSLIDKPFEKIPSGRYINFLADYLKNEHNPTRSAAIQAWKKLKRLDLPKDYKSWKKHLG